MLSVLPASQRGLSQSDGLESHHRFSGGNFLDPRGTGISLLQAVNEHLLAPDAEFVSESVQDVEIARYVISGSLDFQDDLGHREPNGAGHLQLVSCGTGITQRIRNPSSKTPVHYLEVWLRPARLKGRPRIDSRVVDPRAMRERFCLLVSPDGRELSMAANSDARLYLAELPEGAAIEHRLRVGWVGFLHVISGLALVEGAMLSGGDGATLRQCARASFHARQHSLLLLCELP